VAYALKYAVRAVLRLSRLDRLSEEAGASRVLRMAALPSMTEVLSDPFSGSLYWVSSDRDQHPKYRGAAGADFAPAAVVAGNCCCDAHSVSGIGDRELFVAGGAACGGECGCASPKMLSWSIRFGIWILAIAMALDELGVAGNGDRRIPHRLWSIHAGTGDRFRPGWSGSRAIVPGRSLGEKKDDKATNCSRCENELEGEQRPGDSLRFPERVSYV